MAGREDLGMLTEIGSCICVVGCREERDGVSNMDPVKVQSWLWRSQWLLMQSRMGCWEILMIFLMFDIYNTISLFLFCSERWPRFPI